MSCFQVYLHQCTVRNGALHDGYSAKPPSSVMLVTALTVLVVTNERDLPPVSWRSSVHRAARSDTCSRTGIPSFLSSPYRTRGEKLFWRSWGRSVHAAAALMSTLMYDTYKTEADHLTWSLILVNYNSMSFFYNTRHTTFVIIILHLLRFCPWMDQLRWAESLNSGQVCWEKLSLMQTILKSPFLWIWTSRSKLLFLEPAFS